MQSRSPEASLDPSPLVMLVKSHVVADGGRTFATTLGEYRDLKLMLAARKTKLLNFLEDHQGIFSTSRTNPHIVSFSPPLPSPSDLPTFKPGLMEATTGLLEKMLLILESDHRRRVRRAKSAGRDPDHKPTLISHSLVKKLKFELHFFLHCSGFYKQTSKELAELTAVDMGTTPWFEAAVPPLTLLLSSPSSRLFDVHAGPSGHSVSLTPSYVPREHPNAPSNETNPDHLLADEEGAFSVTSAKASVAMCNLLYKAHKKALQVGAAQQQQQQQQHIQCIDMTAGIGGICFKATKLFDQVDAYEVDEERYKLLIANAKAKGLGPPKLNVYCGDSLSIICENTSSPGALPAVMFDPPWGGVNRDKDSPILFNGLELYEVVSRLKGKAKTLGLKLPVNFDFQPTIEALDPNSVTISLQKNVGKQLFIILSLES
ncbi:hypothetical protein TrVE_jg1688 [Triparma verrucosa]|uniref:Trimethylguanosine synthase n=1 Tax=Triparma verrucosa TaxID=1606542 RepID=A0A9W7FIE2_9STRA|nr:hypothetical protein TrVE_jg1688 [Triparma verrucosa]